jgi:hypothetical protein
MPRYNTDWERQEEEAYWDDYYKCRCEWDYDDEKSWECDGCKERRKEWEVQRAKENARKAAEEAADEARLKATGFPDEIKTIRAYLKRIELYAGAELFETRLRIFSKLFTTLLGYEKFLAAQPVFRAVLKKKIAETRANNNSGPLHPVMDDLDALLERLPSVEGYQGVLNLSTP